MSLDVESAEGLNLNLASLMNKHIFFTCTYIYIYDTCIFTYGCAYMRISKGLSGQVLRSLYRPF